MLALNKGGDTMNFLEKLDLLMKQNNLNKKSLSTKSGIPYTTIVNWYTRGYEGLKVSSLQKLNDYFGTTYDFWISDEITNPNHGKTSNFEITHDEMNFIKSYRSLNSYDKETLRILLDREYKKPTINHFNTEEIAALTLGKSIVDNSESDSEQIG